MGSSSLDVVDRILEKEGIVEVNGVRRPAGDDEADSRHRVDSILDVHPQDLPGYASRDRTIPVQDPSVVDLTNSQPNEADPIIDILSARQRTMSTHSPDPQIIESIEQPVENTAYATLLERLIRTARKAYLPLSDTPSHCFCSRTSTLPTFNCTDHHTTYPSIFNFRSLDRDRKVGAAGELFAFEILNHLNLPRFSATANWLSTLRKEARACAAHAALEPWHGAETSDIVYHDAAGALTAELREKGYFGADAVIERPTYYIEVKTTTRGCEEPLFMSGAQYLRMQRMALTPGTPAAEVYVLVRVFNLEREDVGLRVYVDPERHKRAGVLAFNVDTWIVKPDNSQPLPERTIVLD
ncbi:hypothetical protein DIS24_g5934 [Lasiodiplodia hormozganensis]|uniref:Protein NO VEIN C-terminal domain-containing protein n=1 Tax=Lasiodiplodia hormozganensis TaxID=869390 RepID=A0AA39YIY4_9PEZI|nr:hypothetical protein DIS24_g5934 [Lasiodiplodia hormozganensis]